MTHPPRGFERRDMQFLRGSDPVLGHFAGHAELWTGAELLNLENLGMEPFELEISVGCDGFV